MTKPFSQGWPAQDGLQENEPGPEEVPVVCRDGLSATEPGQGLHPNLTKHPIRRPRAREEEIKAPLSLSTQKLWTTLSKSVTYAGMRLLALTAGDLCPSYLHPSVLRIGFRSLCVIMRERATPQLKPFEFSWQKIRNRIRVCYRKRKTKTKISTIQNLWSSHVWS